MDLTDLFQIGGGNLPVNLEGSVTTAQDSLSDHNPRVVVAEDARILLVARRVRGDLSQVQIIGGVGRILQHNAVRGFQTLLDGFQRLQGGAVLRADAGHDAHALGLDENLALGIFLASHFFAKMIIRPQEPVSVKAVFHGGFAHFLYGGFGCFRFPVQTT
ncbi:hypothetical protein D3C76_1443370 [compost metagenome]